MDQLTARFRIRRVQPPQNRLPPRRSRAPAERQSTCALPPSARNTAAPGFCRTARRLRRSGDFLLPVFLFCFGHQAEEYITGNAPLARPRLLLDPHALPEGYVLLDFLRRGARFRVIPGRIQISF